MLGVVLTLLVLAGAGLLWSSGIVWAVHTVQRDEPLPPVAFSLSGSSAVPMVVAAGFIMLAALLAVLATRTIGRRVIALIVLITIGVTAVSMQQWITQSGKEREATILVDGVRHAIDQAPEASSSAIPLVLLCLALGAVAAILLLVTKNLAGMGSKYDRGAATSRRPAAADDDPQTRDRNLWSSLDRGEDPTDS